MASKKGNLMLSSRGKTSDVDQHPCRGLTNGQLTWGCPAGLSQPGSGHGRLS